jgi:SpoVK/Ycf46/Vps4 family AAA+-type ATPase
MQINHYKYIDFIALLLFSNLAYSNQNGNAPQIPPCTVSNMAGEQPHDICYQIKRLLKEEAEGRIQFGPSSKKAKSDEKNVFLFEGPTGTGKTTLAEAFAVDSNSHFYRIDAPTLLDRYIGGTKDALMKEINDALAEGKVHNKRVVILIDEIDKLISNTKSADHNEGDAAISALWCYLDKNQYNSNLFFVFTTNRLNHLPLPFKNRIGSNVISIKSPDAQQRKKLLDFFSERYTTKDLRDYCSGNNIEKIVNEIENFSIRDIEELYIHARREASRESKAVTENHLLYALQQKKANVELLRAPTEEELEKQRTRKREDEQDKMQRETLELQKKSLELQIRTIAMQAVAHRLDWFSLMAEHGTVDALRTKLRQDMVNCTKDI